MAWPSCFPVRTVVDARGVAVACIAQPYPYFGVDEFTIAVISMCRDE